MRTLASNWVNGISAGECAKDDEALERQLSQEWECQQKRCTLDTPREYLCDALYLSILVCSKLRIPFMVLNENAGMVPWRI